MTSGRLGSLGAGFGRLGSGGSANDPVTRYVDSAAAGGGDGLTPETAWNSMTPVAAYPGPLDLQVARDSVFTDPIVFAGNGSTVSAYGSGADPIFNGLVDCKGSGTGDWTDEGGNVWSIAFTPGERDRIVIDGEDSYVARTLPGAADPAAALTQDGDYTITADKLWVYAPSNPYSYYDTIERTAAVNGAGLASNSRITLNDIVLRGWQVGIECGARTQLHGVTVELCGYKGIKLGVNHTTVAWSIITIRHIGSEAVGAAGAGGHGLHIDGGSADNLITVAGTIVGLNIYNCTEDCYQRRFCGACDLTVSGGRIINTHRVGRPKRNENAVDLKHGGGFHLVGVVIAADNEAAITMQLGSNGDTYTECNIIGIGQVGLQMAENVTDVRLRRNIIHSNDYGFYRSASAGLIDSAFNIFHLRGSAGSAALALAEGPISLVHDTIISPNDTSALWIITVDRHGGADVQSIVRVATNVDGTDTYRATENGDWSVNTGTRFNISGLTDAPSAAAIHGTWAFYNTTLGGTAGDFDVPHQAGNPDTITLTGLVFRTVPWWEAFENVALAATEGAIFVGEAHAAVASQSAAAGRFGIQDRGGSNRSVRLSAVHYGEAAVEDGTLAAATSNKLAAAGTGTFSTRSTGNTTYQRPVASLVIAGGVATFDCGTQEHELSVGKVVTVSGVTGSQADYINIPYIVASLTDDFIFTALALESVTDETCSGTITFTDYTPTRQSGFLCAAATGVDLGDDTEDAQGQAFPAIMSLGAVQVDAPGGIYDLAVTGISLTQAQLVFTDARGAMDHEWRFSDAGAGTWSAWAAVPASGFVTVSPDMTAASDYDFQVRGVNTNGNGAASNTDTITAAAAAPITDDFNRADESLTTPWEQVGGTTGDLTVSSNQLRIAVQSNTAYRQALPTPDHYAKATWKTTGNAAQRALAIRLTSHTNHVGVRRNTGGIFELYQIVGGVVTVLGSYAGALNDVTQIEARGSEARLLVNGVERVTWTAFSTTLAAAYVGFINRNGSVVNPWLDDFEARAL